MKGAAAFLPFLFVGEDSLVCYYLHVKVRYY